MSGVVVAGECRLIALFLELSRERDLLFPAMITGIEREHLQVLALLIRLLRARSPQV